MTLATVELNASEIQTLLHLVRSRALDVDRMIQNMEEGEGMDLERHRALKTMRPQADALQDLVLKLEGAAREIAGGRTPA